MYICTMSVLSLSTVSLCHQDKSLVCVCKHLAKLFPILILKVELAK